MKMFWSDLEPGDILKISGEAKEVMIEKGWSFLHPAVKQNNLIVKNVNKDEIENRLYFTFKDGTILFTDNDGKFLKITLFEIVKLREEENEISK